ncbi:MAG: thermonuclease family protein [Magnetococcales bacterium]|nr:thermonuclease family protein [Magnetococcales bacterium]
MPYYRIGLFRNANLRGRLFITVFVFWAALCLIAPVSGRAEAWSGEVVQVTDGDSLIVMRGREKVKIRLSGIDAPEHGQPFAEEAKRFLKERVRGKAVQVEEKERDRYGRLVARVRRPGDDEDLSHALVRAGLAWQHKYFSRDAGLKALERAAREQRVGLWSQPDPTPPWVWKHRGERGR